jgi:DNA-binding beta-propeller fold protein YncE
MKLPEKYLIAGMLALASMALFANEPKPGALGTYSVAKTLNVGGEGRWDYVIINPQTQLLYVPRQSHTQVIKADTGEVVADLKDTPGVHGVALALDAGRGFASNGQGNSVTVFDLKTNKELGNIPAGQKPDCIIYDPGSKKVLAFCGKSDEITVIDPAADPATEKPQSIKLDGAPEFAASDGAGHVYVNFEDKDSVAEIDMKTKKQTAVWKIEGGEGPAAITRYWPCWIPKPAKPSPRCRLAEASTPADSIP